MKELTKAQEQTNSMRKESDFYVPSIIKETKRSTPIEDLDEDDMNLVTLQTEGDLVLNNFISQT